MLVENFLTQNKSRYYHRHIIIVIAQNIETNCEDNILVYETGIRPAALSGLARIWSNKELSGHVLPV